MKQCDTANNDNQDVIRDNGVQTVTPWFLPVRSAALSKYLTAVTDVTNPGF